MADEEFDEGCHECFLGNKQVDGMARHGKRNVMKVVCFDVSVVRHQS